MAGWDTVREIAGALPGTEESTTYGRPAFEVGGKLFAWLSPDRHAEDALAVLVDPGEKHVLIESNPTVYFATAIASRRAGCFVLRSASQPTSPARASRGWPRRNPGPEPGPRGELRDAKMTSGRFPLTMKRSNS